MFIKQPDDIEPQPFVFRGELVWQITGTEQRNKYLYLEFIPPDIVKPSFPSIYHNFDPTSIKYQPLLDGHMFFVGREMKLDFGRKELDLKWAEDVDGREKLGSFIKQLVYQILAEAVSKGIGNVEWRFAYPSAFSEDDREEYLRYWQSILDGDTIFKETGVRAMSMTPVTESVATAKFFEMIPTGLITIDVGGGTTDISIWQRDTLVYQTSVLFAGNDIFEKAARGTDFYGKFINPLLNKLEAAEITALTETRYDHKEFSFILFSILRKPGNEDKLFKSLSNFTGDPTYKRFTNYLSVGMAGLFYYVGLILEELLKEGKYSQDYTNLFIAGNGSKIYKWLLSPEDKLRKLFVEVSKITDINIQPTSSPKSEVVIGLLKEGQVIRYDVGSLNEYIAGEYFKKKGEEQRPQDRLKAKDFADGSVDISELKELKNFFRLFDNAWGTSFSEQVDWKNMVPKMKNEISKLKGKDIRKLRCEPVFFTGLREIMNSIIDL